MPTTTKFTRRQKTKELVLSHTFKHGASFTRSQFVRIAKQINPAVFTLRNNDANKMRSNLELVKTQHLINQELAPQGFYLKSAEYQQLFYIVDDKKTVKEVTRYSNQAINNEERYLILFGGIKAKKRGKNFLEKEAELEVIPTPKDFFKEL